MTLDHLAELILFQMFIASPPQSVVSYSEKARPDS